MKTRSAVEKKELKDQLSSVQEEAHKQVQEITTQLHTKSSQLVEREKEVVSIQKTMEDRVEELNQKIVTKKKEMEQSERVQQEVCVQPGEERIKIRGFILIGCCVIINRGHTISDSELEWGKGMLTRKKIF